VKFVESFNLDFVVKRPASKRGRNNQQEEKVFFHRVPLWADKVQGYKSIDIRLEKRGAEE
jgi:hypothetical protein